MNKKHFSICLFALLIISIFSINSVNADTLNIPSSEKSVVIDANLEPDEWSDAVHLQFDSLNGGIVDVYMKYDKIQQLFLCGYIIDDSTSDPEDIFLLGVDRDASADENISKDDYLLSIFRESYVYSANFHIDTTLGEGTGDGWENYDEFDANINNFKSPFGAFVWARAETSRGGPVQGDTWCGEFSLYLPLTAQTASGSVNDGLTMGFLIGYEDTQPVKDYRFYFYSIGEVAAVPDTLALVSPSEWTLVYLYKDQNLPEPANIEYKSISVDPENIETGQEVTISLTLENTGDIAGNEQVTLYVNNEPSSTKLVTINGREIKIETFTFTPEAGGSYIVKSGTLETSFIVTAPEPLPEPEPDIEPETELSTADISYKSITISPSTLTVGDMATITVTIENTGDEAGTDNIEIFLDNDKIASQTVTIEGKTTETFTFTHIMDTSGTFTAKTGTLTTALTVAEQEPSETDNSTGIPGFPLISILLVLVFYTNARKMEKNNI